MAVLGASANVVWSLSLKLSIFFQDDFIIKIGPYSNDIIIDSFVYTALKICSCHYWNITELLYILCGNDVALEAEHCIHTLFCMF